MAELGRGGVLDKQRKGATLDYRVMINAHEKSNVKPIFGNRKCQLASVVLCSSFHVTSA